MESFSRDRLYNLICGQLQDDGLGDLAAQISLAARIKEKPPAPNELKKMLSRAIADEEAEQESARPGFGYFLDPNAPDYRLRYTTTHKGACYCAAFNPTGDFLASGSEDKSIKLIDVNRMHRYGTAKDSNSDTSTVKPVVRSMYDHTQGVTCLDFHPFTSTTTLISGSKDGTIKFYDYSKHTGKRGYKTIVDGNRIRSVKFHPSGDYILIATNQPIPRIIDIATSKIYVNEIEDHHTDSINCAVFSSDGRYFATASRDGSIKIWDGITCDCVRSFPHAHEGAHVFSVCFSRDGTKLLSCGRDSVVRLWDISTSTQINSFSGAFQQKHKMTAVFDRSERYVLCPDDQTNSIVLWDTTTESIVRQFQGHNQSIRCICVSPVEDSLASAGQDFRLRFWTST